LIFTSTRPAAVVKIISRYSGKYAPAGGNPPEIPRLTAPMKKKPPGKKILENYAGINLMNNNQQALKEETT
jgi:hypothetical protein